MPAAPYVPLRIFSCYTMLEGAIDPKAAAWLKELMKDGLISDGDVDTRSIEDVVPAELAGYDRCHFFAGIGGWSLAARLAGWPDDRELWTGSAPCHAEAAARAGAGGAQSGLLPAGARARTGRRTLTARSMNAAAQCACPGRRHPPRRRS